MLSNFLMALMLKANQVKYAITNVLLFIFKKSCVYILFIINIKQLYKVTPYHGVTLDNFKAVKKKSFLKLLFFKVDCSHDTIRYIFATYFNHLLHRYFTTTTKKLSPQTTVLDITTMRSMSL